MPEVHTEILVDAAPAVVWDILVDLGAYEAWNPFVYPASGEIALGRVIHVRANPEWGRPMRFAPVVVRCEPGRAFSWMGHFLRPGVVDGEHIFELYPEAGGNRTRLVHREVFSGLLARAMFPLLRRTTRQGFEAMNQALAGRAAGMAGNAGKAGMTRE
ncbi:MAG: SRPBCC family protein [Desulfatibacillaceae bacterium]